jgi:hypothetical protein
MGHVLGMKSKVHPKYKTKYRVNNWADWAFCYKFSFVAPTRLPAKPAKACECEDGAENRQAQCAQRGHTATASDLGEGEVLSVDRAATGISRNAGEVEHAIISERDRIVSH